MYAQAENIEVRDTNIAGSDTTVTCTTYYKNHSIRSIKHFLNGKMNGQYQTYFENGKIESQSCYEKGNPLDTVKLFYANGKKHIFRPYNQGKIHGDMYTYDSTGMMVGSEHYISGKVYGLCKYWYPNGQLRKIASFDSLGQMDANNSQYFSNGKIKLYAQYSHGKRISINEYNENGIKIIEEIYQPDGKSIKNAKYRSPNGKPMGEIVNGNGSYIRCADGGVSCTKYFYENGIQVRYEDLPDNNDKNLK
jgi:antitoxin component YwqK of YwqJK toxin-antitoxin module